MSTINIVGSKTRATVRPVLAGTWAFPQRMGRLARQYANFGSERSLALTFDIDFAPDFMIAHLLELLARFGVAATFFATHDTPLLGDIRTCGRYELGIHPFNNPLSTQGKGIENIADSLLTLCPLATGSRFHRLEFAYRDLSVLARRGLRYDASTLRLNCPCLLPAWHADLRMTLMSYSWEDGICEQCAPMRPESIDLSSAGMKVLTFHPLNVYLNAPTAAMRTEFLREHPDLRSCSRRDAEPFRRRGCGAEYVLVQVLRQVREQGIRTFTLGELAETFEDAVTPEGRTC